MCIQEDVRVWLIKVVPVPENGVSECCLRHIVISLDEGLVEVCAGAVVADI